MTELIDIAIGEMGYIQMEIDSIRAELEHPETEFPLTDRCRQALLIRLGVMDNGIKFINQMVINKLCDIPYSQYQTLINNATWQSNKQ